jgi:hypothetical protein
MCRFAVAINVLLTPATAQALSYLSPVTVAPSMDLVVSSSASLDLVRWLECLIMLMTAVVLLLMGMSYYLSCYCSRTEGSRPTSSKTIGKKSRALAESARLASTSYSRLLSDFNCGHHMPAYHVDHLNDCLFDRTLKVAHVHDRKRSLYTISRELPIF